MRYLAAILLMFVSFSLSAQFRMVGTADGAWTTVDDSTYTASITFQSDLTGKGYLATQIADTFRLFTPTEQIYRVSVVADQTFNTATLTVVEMDGTNGSPIGQLLVFDPAGRESIPQGVFGSTGATAQMQAAVDAYNARLTGIANAADVTTAALNDSIQSAQNQANGVENINQLAHGFSIGDPLWYSGDYVLSLDTGLSVRVDGVVIDSVDANNFVWQKTGKFTLTSHGFTVGVQLYVQPDGSYSATDTSNTLVYGYPLDANTIEIGLKDDQVGIIAEKFNSVFSGLPQYKSQAIDTLSRIQSIEDISSLFAQRSRFTEDQKIFVKETGATYQVKSTAPISEDSISVIDRGDGTYLVLDAPDYVDIRWFGAKDVVPYNNIKNQSIVSYTPSYADASDEAIYKAIQYAASFKNGSGTPIKKVIINGQYLVMDSTFNVPNGVSIWCEGSSHVHSNHNNPLFVFDSHFGMSHRVKVVHKQWGGTTVGMEWYPKNTDTFAVDSTSIGIHIINTRRSTFYDLTARNFRHGIEVLGDAEGTVENRFYISELWDNKWDMYINGENGGWAHQNYVEGGLMKTHGLNSRNRTLEVECGAVYLNADNWTFQNVNFEGSTQRKYAIHVLKSSNHFYNCRFEAAAAKQIVFDDIAYSNELHGSYGFIMSNPVNGLPLYYSSDGVTPVKDQNGDNVTGPIFDGTAGTYEVFWGGAAQLAGGLQGTSGNGKNTTLALGTAQPATEAVNLFEAKGGSLRGTRTSVEINSKGEFIHWGTPNVNGGGKSFELDFEQKGYNVTPLTYTPGEWYSYGQIIDTAGTEYAAVRAFKATNTATDINLNMVPNQGARTPKVLMDQNGLAVQSIYGLLSDGATTKLAPSFRNGFAFSESGVFVTASSTPYAVNIAASPGYIINNNTGSDVTVTFTTTGYTPGQVFYIASNRLSTGNIIIQDAGSVLSIDRQDIVIRPGDYSYFRVTFNASNLRIMEIVHNVEDPNYGDTASRPSDLTTEEKGFKYFDTDISLEITWTGTDWFIPQSRDSLVDVSSSSGNAGEIPIADGAGGWNWSSLSYGEAYIDYIDPDSVTVVTAGTLYDFTDVSAGNSSSDVTVSTTTGRLTYTGTTEKLFEITWTASVTSDAVNENLIGTVIDNGATITRIRWEEEDTASGDRHSVSASGFFSMSQNDWVQPKLTSETNGTEVQVITMSFRIQAVR